MRLVAASLFALIALAACSPAADKKGEAPGAAPTVTAPGGGAMSPGQWRTTVSVTAMSMPGLPPGAAAKMKSRPFSSEECVTSADMAEFLGKKANTDPDDAARCTVNRMDHSGGRIEGQSTCTDGAGGSHTVHMTGTYRADRVDMVVNVDGQTSQGPMSQTMSMTSERIGDCPG